MRASTGVYQYSSSDLIISWKMFPLLKTVPGTICFLVLDESSSSFTEHG